MSSFNSFLSKFVDAIVNPVVVLLFAIALLYFLWGVAKYVQNADNDQARAEGSKHMIWGIVGMTIMVSAFAIVNVVVSSFSGVIEIQTEGTILNR